MTVSTDIALPPYHPFVAADVPWLLRQAALDHGPQPLLHRGEFAPLGVQ